MPAAKSIDEYIKGFPPDVQIILKKIRETMKASAPKAEEAIKYAIPAYVLMGNLIFFAGWKKHIGVYPVSNAMKKELKKELEPYEVSKGTVKFPLDKPVPYALIRKMVKLRIKENSAKVKAQA
jgi:uncharacterized protein YdhG (YjbR/CyaY superfamily)